MNNIDRGDLYVPSKESPYRTIVTPRVIALDAEGNFPLHTEKSWYALPGGKQKRTAGDMGNLFDRGAIPTIIREVTEECDVDITPYMDRTVLLGVAEVTEVNALKPQITERIAPIFLCRVPRLVYGPSVVIGNIHTFIPSPLFPDARMALTYLQHQIYSGHARGPIEPVFFNNGKVYFQTKPTMGYIWGIPQ